MHKRLKFFGCTTGPLRQMQNMSANFYSNSLHHALRMKDGAAYGGVGVQI